MFEENLGLRALHLPVRRRKICCCRANADECGFEDQDDGCVCTYWRIKVSFGNGAVRYFPPPHVWLCGTYLEHHCVS